MEAAVSVFEGSLGNVLEKLQLLATECSRIKGVGKQIVFLSSELASMHALLHKVAAMEDDGPPMDVQVKAWAREVREMAYDVEDCVDAFAAHRRRLAFAAGEGQGGVGVKEFFARCARFLLTLRSWRQFANQIDALKARAVEAGERRERYRLDDLASSSSSSSYSGVDPRLSALFADEDCLVGIDGPRDELVRWLLLEPPAEAGAAAASSSSSSAATATGTGTAMYLYPKVLSIVGFGGLGKTTLANQVYREIEHRFVCKAFVSVSQKPNLKHILRDCLHQLCHDREFVQEICIWDEKEIITKIREYIAPKRYLIVIDDVWSTSAWDAIKCAFPKNTHGSRIITTTRIVDVAGSCCSGIHDRVYEMEPLNYQYSKRLFLKRIFGSEECRVQLQETSDEILKKCGGLPLAITSISALLANKPDVKEEWEKVRNSIGSALESHRNMEGIKAILGLSYNDLQHHLKTCLLYLSIFPEDCNIERTRLINRWIAEGFIPQERRQSLQDVAENYFYELINKNMVQPTDIGYDGKVSACRVHDIMLELIISKAVEENFITIIGTQSSIIAYPQCNIRRLSIQQAHQQVTSVLQGKDLSGVRSLTSFDLVKYLPRLLQFEVLRVLDFEGCMGLEEYDLSNIDKLTQLKYLSLRDTRISKVPLELVKLHDLQTLDLRWINMVQLPIGIVHLTKLQNLLIGKFDEGTKIIPDGIGNMRNLQVLSGFNISMSSITAVQDISKLSSLKELHIQLNAEGHDMSNRHEEVLLSTLCKLGSCRLQYLGIYSSNSTSMEFLDYWSPLPTSLQRFRMSTDYHFLKIPKWIGPALTSLAYLNINLSEITQEDVGILGELHALLSLELWFKTVPKERLIVHCRGFQCLKEFNIVCRHFRLRGMAYLSFEIKALPKLEKIKLPFSVSMAKDYGFYLGIHHLRCLKHAKVILGTEGATSYESKAAATSIRNEANVHPNHPRLDIAGEPQ